jgi:hypothetical protein
MTEFDRQCDVIDAAMRKLLEEIRREIREEAQGA